MDPSKSKLKKLLDAAASADHEKLALRDALIEGFRVTMAGVDVTQKAPPQLPPELAKRKRKRRK